MQLPLLVLIFSTITTASILRVASYNGNITTLNFTRSPDPENNSTYSLTRLFPSVACAPNATWFTYYPRDRTIFCLGEGIHGPNGFINSYRISNTSTLISVARHVTGPQPVHAELYVTLDERRDKLLVVAEYGHGISTWRVNSNLTFNIYENFDFVPTQTELVARRDSTAHPHQILIDPTNTFVVVPDLGADLLRVFEIQRGTPRLIEKDEFRVPRGSGPRHGCFLGRKGGTFLYIVAESSSELLTYRVRYEGGGLGFEQLGEALPTYGKERNESVVGRNYPSEIRSGGGGRNLYISNRKSMSVEKDGRDDVASFGSIAHFRVGEDGVPIFSVLSAAGGRDPRSFNIGYGGYGEEGEGTEVMAIGLQKDGVVRIVKIDGETGRVGEEPMADFGGLGEVTSVVWT